jgi:hypothetical protein
MRFTIASKGEKYNKNCHISKFGSQCSQNIKKFDISYLVYKQIILGTIAASSTSSYVAYAC